MNAKTQNTIPAPASNNGVIKRTNAYFIDPKAITRREGFNPRFDFGDIQALATSIQANGLLNAIRVKRISDHPEGKLFELIDGDRRLTAIELLLKSGHDFAEGVPAILVDKAIEDVEALIQMFEANSGKAFLPLEEAAAYQRMRDAGLTIKQICSRVGRAHVHVTSTLALLNTDASVQEALEKKQITGTLAKQIAVKAKGDKVKQQEMVAKAKSGKAGKKAVKEEAERIQRRPSKSGKTGQQTLVEKAPAPQKLASAKQLREFEEKALAGFAKLSKGLGLHEANIRPFVQESDERVVSYYFGLILGLRMALGYNPKAEM